MRDGFQPVVAANLLTGLDDFLERRGLRLADIKTSAGPVPGAADRGEDEFIPLASYARLLKAAAETAGDPAFGLHFGEAFPVGGSGALGYAAGNAPDVRTMFQTMERYAETVVSVSKVDFADQGAAARFRWRWPEALSPRGQLTDFIAAVICERVRLAAGREWQPLSVCLDRARPETLGEHHRLFGPRIEFSRLDNEIALERRTLDLPLPGADPNLYKTVKFCCDLCLSRVEAERHPLNELRRAVVDGLPERKISLEAVARRLGRQPRELQRLARRHGTSFHDLVEATRRDVAHHYLADTDLSLTEIAFLLGYSELSAFSRAARRWFGMSARNYRGRRLRG